MCSMHARQPFFTEPARPFDFIINEQLLRKTLEQHLVDNQLSTVRIAERHCYMSLIVSN